MKTIRVETNGSQSFRDWRVFLDETDISKFINRLNISAGVNEMTKVTVTLITHDLDIPAEIKGLVTVEDK